MIWKDDANTSYRKGEKIRIDLYAKSTDGGADRLVKSQEVTPIEKTVYILSIMLRKFSKMLMVAILIIALTEKCHFMTSTAENYIQHHRESHRYH